MYVIESLNTHDRKSFDCGEDTLNRYLHERATQDIKRRLNRVFIIRQPENSQILGYYTLSATSIAAAQLPEAHTKQLPRYPIPAAMMGKLAVDKAHQGKGLGKLLVIDAIRRIQAADIAVHVLVVDPKHDDLIAFYVDLGFLHIPPHTRLFLFMKDVPEPTKR